MQQPQTRTISVKHGYELWAPTYGVERNPLLALQERTLDPLIPDVSGLRVLDIGCGTGRWLKRLIARKPAAALGLDSSLAMLHNSCASLRQQVVCSDSSALSVRDGWADFILCSLVLDHISDLEAFAREASRVAADGAGFLLSEFHPDAHRRGWKRSFASGEQRFEFEIAPRPLRDVKRAFTHAGFEVEFCSEPCFGEADREVFLQLGRDDLFEAAATSGPALFHMFLRRSRRNLAFAVYDVAETLVLDNAGIAISAEESMPGRLTIAEGIIADMGECSSRAANAVDLSGYLLLPGLVNAHDHLEFALFPRLGRGDYPNAQSWAEDIHRPDSTPIGAYLRVPKDVRLWWGGLKNLLSGVTTVHEHNPFLPDVFGEDFPVRVADCGWAHSFAFEPDVPGRNASTPAGTPFIIHLGEGADGTSQAEFARLKTSCGLASNTVLVHAVALTKSEAEELEDAGGAIVWCPSSNLFLLGKTLTQEIVARFPRLALATDSPISGGGDLFDEIKLARDLGSAPHRIYDMVTRLAAGVLKSCSGRISAGLPADLIAVRDPATSPADALVAMNHAALELVMVGGKVRLISPELRSRWPARLPDSLEPILIDGVRRYVDAPVGRLLASAQAQLGPDIRLGHKRVWQ